MKYGRKGGTALETKRHRSYCQRHGYMTWEEYSKQPGLRGPRTVGWFQRLKLKAILWANLLMFNAGSTPSLKSAASRAKTKAKGKGRARSITSAKVLALANDPQTVVRFASVSDTTHQAPAESLSMLELASGDGTKKNS